MSTNGTIGFTLNKTDILIVTFHDSFPIGIGKDMLYFISNINKINGWDVLIDTLEKSRFGIFDIPNIFKELCRILHVQRDMPLLEDYFNDNIYYNNDFIKNSLLCEYGYIINLDYMILEFYRGHQREAQFNNRFGNDTVFGYYPCRLSKIFNLYDIKDDINFFIKEMEVKDSSIDFNNYIRRFKLNDIIKKGK